MRRIYVPVDQSTYQAKLRWLIVQRGFRITELAAKFKVGGEYFKRILALPGTSTYGRKTVSPRILNALLDVLMVTKEQRTEINRMAARSDGYQL